MKNNDNTTSGEPLIAPHATALDACLAFLVNYSGERCQLTRSGGEPCALDGPYACSTCTARRLAAAADVELGQVRGTARGLRGIMIAKQYPKEVQAMTSNLCALLAQDGPEPAPAAPTAEPAAEG